MSGWAIWSFHTLNYSLHISRFFSFYDPELPAASGAWWHKVQFLMRRQHQMVAFAAPGYMITKSAPVGGLALFPLDRYIFVKSGHFAEPPKTHSIPPCGEPQEIR